MKLNDAVFGLLLLALGVAVLLAVQSFPNIPGQKVGPALFPGLIAAGLCVGGFLLIVQGLRARASVPWVTLASWTRSPRHLLGFALLILSVVFYMLASERLGFLPCAVLLLTALFHVLRTIQAGLATSFLGGGRVFYRATDGAIVCVDRARLRDVPGMSDSTPVFDTALTTAVEYRARFERPLRDSWHRELLSTGTPR